MYAKIKNLVNLILDLLYKRKCVHCACVIQSGILCKTCAKDVQNLPFFAQGIINGYKVYSAFNYEGAIKSLVLALKFKHNKNIADFIAEYTAEYLLKLKNEINLENAIIVPIPTHISNIKKRGFDNIYEISKVLGSMLNIEVENNALKRVRQNVSQYKLSVSQRKKNLLGCFELDCNFKTDKQIILFDDITTTGATLEVITDLFKEKGIDNLICVTFAKTKKKRKF